MKFRSRSHSHPSFIALAAIALLCASLVPARAESWLFDFGSTNLVTGQPDLWNSVPNTVATSNTGQLLDLFNTGGTQTSMDLLMVSRFNGENQNGTTTSTVYPANATRDSMYGNTEDWQGLSNIFPVFKLAQLDPALTYSFTFYASRTGVTDNRTTDYGVSGSISGTVSLNVANNVNNTVTLAGISPDAFGEITISLLPGAANNNANHFTYLGVLRVDSIPEPASATMFIGGLTSLCLRRSRRR